GEAGGADVARARDPRCHHRSPDRVGESNRESPRRGRSATRHPHAAASARGDEHVRCPGRSENAASYPRRREEEEKERIMTPHLIELVAVLSCTLFAGAAVYVTAVEHPARMSCGTEIAVTEWAPSYKRATVMQASLAVIAGLFGLLRAAQGGGPLW